ncbi:helix-turn-helix domain-containing protein [Actinoplanes sp. NPDC049548]|uniref:helix-turn-helix domain-containing protein n=1 Tax=Actinoplanes sp. NPDC049548 TaxID=3155152 RepID=UPI003433DCF7
MTALDALLTIDETAKRLRTSERFVRRLIEERRIAYVKLGTHVRIEESVLSAYIAAHRVAPTPMRRAA